MKHTISVIVENKAGVLSRVSGLFARRGFNIESLAVGITEDPKISRVTIVAEGDEKDLEQIIKQLYKLIDTLKVFDLPKDKSVEREIALIKVSTADKTLPEITELSNAFGAHIADASEGAVIIEISDESAKVDGLIEALKKYGIKEVARTGRIALLRGTSE